MGYAALTASVTLIFNSDVPTSIPLEVQLPNQSLLPLPTGVPVHFSLLNSAVDGSTDNTTSQLGTAALGSDGISVDIFPTRTGQLGYALLETTAQLSPSTTAVGGLLLLFLDQISQLTVIYDVTNIDRG